MTDQNDRAVGYLRMAQESLGMSNREFAKAMGHELGCALSESTYSYYASGGSRRQPVPAAVIYAAARLSGLPLDKEAERSLGARLRRLEDRMKRLDAMLSDHPEIRDREHRP